MTKTLLAVTLAGLAAFTAGAAANADKQPKPPLRHVVLFKFREDVSQKKIDEVTKAFAALPEEIDVIRDFEWGTDVSVEQKAKGFTHGFVVTFADENGRDAYLPHPAHKEFVEMVGPTLDDVLVFDFHAR